VATDTPATDTPATDTPASPTGAPAPRLRWWREVLYIGLVYAAYSAVRNTFGSSGGGTIDPEPAFNHAKAMIDVEEALRLYFEPSLQSWYLDLPADGVIRLWNVFYGLAHFLVTAAALIWLYRADKARYPLWRNTLAATTLLALVGFASFSLMPPRLMDDPGEYGGCQIYAPEAAARAQPGDLAAPGCDEFGYVDTVARYGGWASFGSEELKSVSNQYAAMPSMHIGWSLWATIVLVPLARRRWLRVLACAHPVATLFCIIVTGNHYWIDGVGGALCLGAGFAVARVLTPRLTRTRVLATSG
jgi:hypothetical protein